MKIQKELSECTFYPNINKNKNIGEKNKSQIEGNFYERQINWKNKIKNK